MEDPTGRLVIQAFVAGEAATFAIVSRAPQPRPSQASR
jgi:hypothetical protein